MKAGRAVLTWLITVALWVGLTAGCDEHDSSRPPAVSGPVPPGRQVPPTDEPARFELTDAVMARPGQDYRPLAVLKGSRPSGRVLGAQGMSPDGKVLATQSEGQDSEGAHGIELASRSVLLIDPTTGGRRYLSHSSGPPGAVRQVVGIAADRRWVVWKETTSTDLFTDPWTLFSYDRRRHVTRRIAVAPKTPSGVNPVAAGYSRPSLASDGRVYLGVVEPSGRHDYRPYVESVPADGSAGLRREERGLGPVASGSRLVWVTPTSASGRFAVRERDLRSGRETTLFDSAGTSCRSISGLGVAGDVAAWLVRCGHSERVDVMVGDHLAATITGDRLGYFEVTSGYVGFASGSGPYRQFIYQITTGRLLRVGAGQVVGGDMPGSGNYLMWLAEPPSYAPGDTFDTHIVQLLP